MPLLPHSGTSPHSAPRRSISLPCPVISTIPASDRTSLEEAESSVAHVLPNTIVIQDCMPRVDCLITVHNKYGGLDTRQLLQLSAYLLQSRWLDKPNIRPDFVCGPGALSPSQRGLANHIVGSWSVVEEGQMFALFDCKVSVLRYAHKKKTHLSGTR